VARRALLVALALALAGCASSSSSGPSPRPLERADGLSSRAIDAAIRDFVGRVSERSAQGWPPSVARDEYGKATVEVRRVTNRTREHLDTDDIASRLQLALVDSGVVHVIAAPPVDPLERGCFPLSVDAAHEPPGEGATLVARATISDERQQSGGAEVTDHWVTIELIDTANRSVVLGTRSRSRTSRETAPR
jgi:hypothetical protein